MAAPQYDRNLLTGILALQMDFINSDQLVRAMQAWLLDRAIPLEEVLLAQESLRSDTHEFLCAMVAKHLEMHGGDPERSLAALSSLSGVRQELHDLNDADVEATLTKALADHDQRHTSTLAFRPSMSAAGGRFRVLRAHARGGLGQVSIARDEELHREVALKEIQPRFAADADSRQRFLVEAEVTGRLEHPSVVPVYSLGQFEDGRPFYVMRFIRGDSLKEAISELHQHASSSTSLAWLRELRKLLGRLIDVCNAIEYAHSRGILHRDLKPGNIMLGKYGETLVVDWGLAKSLDRAEPPASVTEGLLKPSSGDSSSATVTGSVVGTPAYMSPEQAEGRLDLLGPATDVYSLGATLYCLLTQQPPFLKDEREEVLSLVRRGVFPPPRSINPRVPRALEAICLKAMARDYRDRYSSPLALADDLERWLADESVSVYSDPWIDRGLRAIRHHKTAFVGLAVLVATALVGLGIVSGILARKNAELRTARERAEENRALAIREQGRAESNLVTSRKLAIDLLGLAENELSKIKGKEGLRKQMTDQSASLFREFHKQRPDDHQLRMELAQVVRMEANITRLMGNTPASLASFSEAVGLLKGLHAEKPSDLLLQDRLAETLRDQGNAQKVQGQLEAAAQSHGRARELAAALVAAKPLEQNYRRTMATLDVDLADLQTQLGQPNDALQAAHSAVTALREFVDGGSNYPVDPILLLLALAREGEVLVALDRHDESDTVFNEALRRARARLAIGPEKNTQYLLGRALTGLAKSKIQRGLPEDASLALDEAISILQKLIGDFPATATYPRFLAAALNARGEVFSTKFDWPAATAEFERARRAMVALAGKADADIADLEALADSLGHLGRVAVSQRQPGAGEKLDEAIGLLERITQRAPGHAPASRKIRQIDELRRSLQR